MHGLIFETSIWLLAGSTRWLVELTPENAQTNRGSTLSRFPKWICKLMSHTSQASRDQAAQADGIQCYQELTSPYILTASARGCILTHSFVGQAKLPILSQQLGSETSPPSPWNWAFSGLIQQKIEIQQHNNDINNNFYYEDPVRTNR